MNLDAAAELMDAELRDAAHCELAGLCTPEEFYTRYCELHLAKYGEEFAYV